MLAATPVDLLGPAGLKREVFQRLGHISDPLAPESGFSVHLTHLGDAEAVGDVSQWVDW